MMGGVKRRKKPLNAKEAPSLRGDHLQPFGRLPHSSLLPQFGGGRQGDTFNFLQAYELSDLSALIFCLLFHQGKSKRQKVIAG
jgi:hypothetical protein